MDTNVFTAPSRRDRSVNPQPDERPTLSPLSNRDQDPFAPPGLSSPHSTTSRLTHQPGPSGITFLDHALAAGHEVTVYARTPSKLEPATIANPKVHIVQGEFTEKDKNKLQQAIGLGPTVLVSFAGPSPSPFAKGTVCQLTQH